MLNITDRLDGAWLKAEWDSSQVRLLGKWALPLGGLSSKSRGSEVRTGVRVLIVSPDSFCTEERAGLISNWGHDAFVAHDGFDALRKAALVQPHVVLIQLELSWLNGYQVAQHLRSDFPSNDCLIVGIAGRENEPKRSQSLASGIDVLFVEPVSHENLSTLLALESIRNGR